jgi:hypothetical protein
MLGKVAHICAAEKGGLRYDPPMTNEQRRAFENLMIVCGKHHDIIDDKRNLKEYPADVLKKYKASHEGRFQRAERQLLSQFVDTTQTAKPTYPINLKGLAKATRRTKIVGQSDHIRGIRDFIDNLKELPLEQRAFALKLAERMRRNDMSELLVEDVMGAFQISATALKRHMRVLEHWRLGSIEEFGEDQHVVTLWDREPDSTPWDEVLEFCEETRHAPDEFVYELNFGLYDDRDDAQ